MRKLFEDAEKDEKELGPGSELHVIIFDEIDAICKARGSVQSGGGMLMPVIRVCHHPICSATFVAISLENRFRSTSIVFRILSATSYCASVCGHLGNAPTILGNFHMTYKAFLAQFTGASLSRAGVHDTLVNQLLTKIDGVDSLNNILLIGMTNRKVLPIDAGNLT